MQLDWDIIRIQWFTAELISKRSLRSPPKPETEPIALDADWEREDPNRPLPEWNTWGDAGLLTRPDIYSPYTKQERVCPVRTDG